MSTQTFARIWGILFLIIGGAGRPGIRNLMLRGKLLS